ncbi:MAG: class I SAM-dependent methyltransferase, partial [Candidatus Omnitrophica bacterium]|nr:class I SAM-dependent methyltransferase [Candidatus Omnitrophota bacterium]
KTKVEAQKITSFFHNSLTFAFTESMGRSYGGGVLELEPNEAEKLPLPLINVPKNFLKELDKEFRKAKDIDAVLQKTDDLLLRKAMRLSVNEIQMLRAIWKKLSSRRIERKFN